MGCDSYKWARSSHYERLIDHNPAPDRPKAEMLKLKVQKDFDSNKSYNTMARHEDNSPSKSSPYARPLYHEPNSDKLKLNKSNLDWSLMPVTANYICNRCNGRGKWPCRTLEESPLTLI